jgi:hypothetical protein
MVQRTDAQIHEIIAMCDGELGGALRALILVNNHLEIELENLVAASSDPQTEYLLH